MVKKKILALGLYMIVHNFKDSDIQKGDTLSSPKHLKKGELLTYDRVIANPPFSLKKWWHPAEVRTDDNEKKEKPVKYNSDVSDLYGRFKYGIPPRGYGDLAFVQHMISVLKNNGRMGVVLPHGILFRGGTEGKIRQGLLNDDIVEAIVGLPEKLFYNTGIPASIIIINKNKADNLKNRVVFIDASSEYKDGKNQNTLTQENIKKIVDAYDGLQTIDKFMRVVEMSEIVENDYNLNISRYIDTSEDEIIIDIKAVREDIVKLENKEQEIDKKLNDYLMSLGF